MNKTILSFLILFVIKSVETEKICESTDLAQYHTECKNDKRDILPNIASELDCSRKCGKGKYLTFNFDNKVEECKKCPKNTFSTGGALVINGILKEWTVDNLKNFNNHCRIINFEKLSLGTKNSNCIPWEISKSNNYIQTGISEIDNNLYSTEISFAVYLKKPGFIELKYKTDRNEDPYCIIQFMTNFDLKFRLNCLQDKWTNYRLELDKGHHNFIIDFRRQNNFSSIQSNNSRAYIEYINVEGINFSQTRCKKCIEGTSEEGSDSCLFCNENYYYNEETQLCEICPNNKISYPNSIGIISCKQRTTCSENDYERKFANCKNGTRIISFKWNEQTICDKSSSILPTDYQEICIEECPEGSYLIKNQNICEVCKDGQYSNKETFLITKERCLDCPNNLYTPKYFYTNTSNSIKFFQNICSTKHFGHCYHYKGYKINNNKFISGSFISNFVNFTLIIDFEILLEQGNLSFTALFNLRDQEKFTFEVIGVLIDNFDFGLYTKQYILKKGKYKAIWRYSRENSTNNENAVEITSINIEGSNLGGGVNCIKCPEVFYNFIKGSIRNNSSSSSCKSCNIGFTSNEERNKCIPCNYGTLNGNSKTSYCIGCPIFTSPSNKKLECEVLDVVHNKKYLSKFYPILGKEKLKIYCNEEIERCLDSFVGPISNKNIKSEFYYISPYFLNEFKSNEIINKGSKSDQGYIFAVFNQNKDRIEKINHLKNIGRKIEFVKVFPFILLNNKIIDSQGYFIKYKDGDLCSNDYSRFYSSYIIFSCDYSLKYSRPKLLYTLDNSCTYVFEWKSKNFCPSCIKINNSNHIKGVCNNSKRVIQYKDEKCQIINIQNKEYSGANFTDNDDSNIILDVSKESTLQLYFQSFNMTNNILENKRKIINVNLSLEDSYYYVTNFKEDESCSILESFDDIMLILVIILSIVYSISIILLIVLFFKYRKIRNSYLLLKDTDIKDNEKAP